MRIKTIEPIAVSLPMKKPVQMAGETVARADNVLVRIESEDGVVGWGEAASAPVMTGETVASMMAAVAHLAPGLLSRDAVDFAGAAAAMDAAHLRQQRRQGGHRHRAARSRRPRHRAAGSCAARRQTARPHAGLGRDRLAGRRGRYPRSAGALGRGLSRLQDQGRTRLRRRPMPSARERSARR